MRPRVSHWIARSVSLWLAWIAVGFGVFVGVWRLALPAFFDSDPEGRARPIVYAGGLIPMAVLGPLLLLALFAIARMPRYRVGAIGLGLLTAVVHSLTFIGLYGLPGAQLAYIGLAATVPRAPRSPRIPPSSNNQVTGTR